jgi:hypothetical protein
MVWPVMSVRHHDESSSSVTTRCLQRHSLACELLPVLECVCECVCMHAPHHYYHVISSRPRPSTRKHKHNKESHSAYAASQPAGVDDTRSERCRLGMRVAPPSREKTHAIALSFSSRQRRRGRRRRRRRVNAPSRETTNLVVKFHLTAESAVPV